MSAFQNMYSISPIDISVFPKKHISGLGTVSTKDSAVLGHIQVVISEIVNRIIQLRYNGFRVFTDYKKTANQSISKLHYRLVGGKPLGDAIGGHYTYNKLGQSESIVLLPPIYDLTAHHQHDFDKNCTFCIKARENSKETALYEDDSVLAFQDIKPRAPIHILIIPKKHISGLGTVSTKDSAVLGHIQVVISEIINRTPELRDNGFRVFTNYGANAEQTVFHLHYHLVGGKPLGDAIGGSFD